MEYILFLTYRCNLNCEYCFVKNLVQDKEKRRLSITSEKIQQICAYIQNDIRINNRKNNSIVFFGGEPSLVPNIISEIIDKTSHLNLSYSIYTNGLALNQMPNSLLKKLHSILVAIDGHKNVHETYKPIGSYEKIINNVSAVKRVTNAQIVARITMEENTNIYHSVKNLLNLFDYVHWQVVNKDEFQNPKKLIENYALDLQKLFQMWKESLNKGVVLNIIPFNRIVLSLLTPEALVSFRCGCGSSIQAIDIDGDIYSCDECVGNKSLSIGSVSDNKYNLLQYKSHQNIFPDCVKCDVSSICLGRCRKCLETQPPEHIRTYCELTKILIKMITMSIDEIRESIKTNQIDLKRLHTEVYETEVIP